MAYFWQRLFIDFFEMDKINLTKKKMLFIGLLYMWIHFMILIFFVSTSATHKIVLLCAWAVNMFTIYLLCRKTNITNAVYLLTVAWLLNVTNTAWHTGGIYSTAMLWQILLIFILVAYLNRLAGVWATFYTIINYGVFFYLQYSGLKDFKAAIVYNPPYYELISVSSLYVIILCCLFFIFTEENLNQIWKKEKEVKIDSLEVQLERKMQEIGVLRKKIASDFHDEMGNKLASIRLLSENLSIKSEQHKLEQKELLKTLQIIEKRSKELFEGTKDFIWSEGTISDKIIDFFDYIREFAEKFLNELDINISSHYDISDDIGLKINPSITRQLIFVLKEIITNTAKHSTANQVIMNFCIQHNHQLLITIIDNGIGFDISNAKQNGLKNIEQRLFKIGAAYICNSNNEGTKYQIFVNLGE